MTFTLLPHRSFEYTATLLRIEELQDMAELTGKILDHLHDVPDRTADVSIHMLNMWRGYEPQLVTYGTYMLAEQYQRTGKSLDDGELSEHMTWHLECATSGEFTLARPPWTEDPRVHQSHVSHLLRVDYDWYSRMFTSYKLNLEVFWPDSER